MGVMRNDRTVHATGSVTVAQLEAAARRLAERGGEDDLTDIALYLEDAAVVFDAAGFTVPAGFLPAGDDT